MKNLKCAIKSAKNKGDLIDLLSKMADVATIDRRYLAKLKFGQIKKLAFLAIAKMSDIKIITETHRNGFTYFITVDGFYHYSRQAAAFARSLQRAIEQSKWIASGNQEILNTFFRWC